jgi:hypothetical protein
LNIIVDPEFDVVERRDFSIIAGSIINDADESDSDKQNEEDNVIFIGNGKLDSQREYVINLVTLILMNLML